MRPLAKLLSRYSLSCVLVGTSLALLATPASALPGQSIPGGFELRFNHLSLSSGQVQPEFSVVRAFDFSIDFNGPLEAGRTYGNGDLSEVRYSVNGRLNLNPPTPSGFRAFGLVRNQRGEGPISPEEWSGQGSQLSFEIDAGADLRDGVQLSELVPSTQKDDRILLEINAVEFGRLDRARYHPPQLLLYADGTGLLWNANNSSKNTGTTNPATGEEVHVDFGEEYITRLEFDPSAITIIGPPSLPVPEPGTALLLGLGLAGLARKRG